MNQHCKKNYCVRALLVFASVFISNGTVSAQEQTDIPEIPVLLRLDRDGDGQLQKREIPKEAKAFVVSLIKDYDAMFAVNKKTGDIDLALLSAALQKHALDPSKSVSPPPPPTDREILEYAERLIQLYDKNQNDSLEASEFEKLSSAWIDCDINQDLRLDVPEVAAGLRYALKFPRLPDGSFDAERANADRKSLVAEYRKLQKEREEKESNANQNLRDKPDHSRRNAKTLLATYDLDKSGDLDLTELKKIGPSWLEVDYDKNGKVSVDELQVRMQDYENGRVSSTVSSDSKQNIDSNRPTAGPSKVSESHSAPPSENANMSDEFKQLDADKDGQIAMHEFAKEFDSTVVKDFYLRDTNRDGFITRNEWKRFRATQNSAEAQKESEPDLDTPIK